jgi:hypothetical protein
MLLTSELEVARAIKDWGPVAQGEWHRLQHFENYFRGHHRAPYTPETATREFKELVHRSTTNVTPLVVNTMTQRAFVDGFRPSATSVENAPQWEWWQANGMDSRQKSLYDEVAKHGYAGCMVTPGDPMPVIRPVSAREWWLGFEDYSDDFPFLGLKQPARRYKPMGTPEDIRYDYEVWHVLDEQARWVVRVHGDKGVQVESRTIHNLGVVPIVPYRNNWDLTRYPTGEIEPIIPVQDRTNQTVMDLLVAQTYAASPQKWATGMALPVDKNGEPLIDLRAWAKSLWMTSDENAKFGSLPEANLKNIVEAIEQCLRVYGLTSQTPPHYLLGDLVNLSAEALLAADTTLSNKIKDRQIIWGEAHEQMFRLAGAAANDEAAANDQEAQVWWRDTEPRSIAQQVDALGKMATMLQIPPESLWEKVPGATGSDLQLWKTDAAKARLRALREGPQTVTSGANSAERVPGVPGGTPADRALGG